MKTILSTRLATGAQDRTYHRVLCIDTAGGPERQLALFHFSLSRDIFARPRLQRALAVALQLRRLCHTAVLGRRRSQRRPSKRATKVETRPRPGLRGRLWRARLVWLFGFGLRRPRVGAGLQPSQRCGALAAAKTSPGVKFKIRRVCAELATAAEHTQ